MLRFALTAAALRHGFATCAAGEADSEGACVVEGGDEIAALQVAAGAQKKLIETIPIDGVEDYIPWRNFSKGNPECMQGVIWMDQSCIGTSALPKDQQKEPCSGWTYAQNEYTTSFGPWDPKTKCFTLRRDSWTIGDESLATEICWNSGPKFCMDKRSKERGDGPCTPGAFYNNVGDTYARFFNMVATKYGFDRITGITHYNVFHIVDKHGKRTKWYDMYVNSAKQGGCPREGRGGSGCQGPVQKSWQKKGVFGRCVKDGVR